MIDEKKLIKAINEIHYYIMGIRSWKTVTTEYLNQFKNDVIRTIEMQPKVGEWIPCSERLPEESGEYLVWVEEVGCDVAWYEVALCAFGEWHHDALGLLPGELLELEDVVAWQPLPQQYRGGE